MMNKTHLSYAKYFFKILIKNKIVWFFIILSIIISILVEVFLVVDNESNLHLSFIKKSFIIVAIPNVLLLFTSGIMNIILLSNTKNNNVDLYLYTKPISKFKIVLIKQVVIFIFLLYLIIIQIIVLVFRLNLNLNKIDVILISLSSIFSLLIMSFIWISLFSLFALYLKPLFSTMLIFLTAFGFTTGAFLPAAMSKHEGLNIDFNAMNKNNVLKVMNVDDNGNVIAQENIIYQNPLAQNGNKLIFNDSTSVNAYLPFEAAFGFSPILTSNILKNFSDVNAYSQDLWWSTLKLNTSQEFTSSLSTYSNIVFSHLNTKTIYEYDDKIALYQDILTQLSDNEFVKNLILDSNKAQALFNVLKNNDVWNNLNDNDKEIIKHILGLTQAKTLLYDLFENYDLLKSKVNNLFDYLKTKTNNAFASLIQLLLTERKTRSNVYYLQNILPLDQINAVHPNLKSFDDYAIVNEFDIDFIKKILFSVNADSSGKISIFKYLDTTSHYKTLDFSVVFPNITTISDWNNYIDRNNNLVNLKSLISDLNTKIIDLKKFDFRENISDPLMINQKLNFIFENKNNFSWIYVIILVIISVGIQNIIFRKVTKKDLV